ncbi:MAG TPA: hypothetical protein PK980_08060, partial [Paludibacteraceae bacterium]|nr:hypothetical protein [Paludibacteraceae bacterium]
LDNLVKDTECFVPGLICEGKFSSLTSFGRTFGFLSDLAMCVVVKRWLFLIVETVLLFVNIHSTRFKPCAMVNFNWNEFFLFCFFFGFGFFMAAVFTIHHQVFAVLV